jgi:hypothetical protein
MNDNEKDIKLIKKNQEGFSIFYSSSELKIINDYNDDNNDNSIIIQ